eukprot:4661978-Ditylum_brightwellii.AAC.1
MKCVHCSEKFVDTPTLTLEDRDRSSPCPAGTDYDIRFGAIQGRNNVERFPEWRKLRRIQEII